MLPIRFMVGFNLLLPGLRMRCLLLVLASSAYGQVTIVNMVDIVNIVNIVTIVTINTIVTII